MNETEQALIEVASRFFECVSSADVDGASDLVYHYLELRGGIAPLLPASGSRLECNPLSEQVDRPFVTQAQERLISALTYLQSGNGVTARTIAWQLVNILWTSPHKEGPPCRSSFPLVM